MTKSKKLILGTTIVTFLCILSFYYMNSQNKKAVTNNQLTQNSESQVNSADNLKKKENEVTENNKIKTDNKVNETSMLNSSEINQEDKTQINNLINRYYDVTNKYQPKIYATKSQVDVKELFTKKKEIIDSYKNIVNYIRPGLTENTYVVFTVYKIKIKNIKTMVPGMSVLSVVKDEKGNFLINNAPNNKKTTNYIKQLAEDKNIIKVITGVNTRLTDALKTDTSLNKFVKNVKEIS